MTAGSNLDSLTSLASLRSHLTGGGCSAHTTYSSTGSSSVADAFVAKVELAFQEEENVKKQLLSPAVGLVGREQETKMLSDALLKKGPKRPRAIAVTGRAGTGKSSLVRTTLEQIEQDQAVLPDGDHQKLVVCHGKCIPNGGEIGLVKSIQSLVQQVTSEESMLEARLQAAIRPQDASVLIESFPSLAALFPSEQDASEPSVAKNTSQDQTRQAKRQQFLFVQFLSVLSLHFSPSTRFVLVVEDTQWADSRSSELLSCLVKDPDLAEAFTLVTTSRPPDEKDDTLNNPFQQEQKRWQHSFSRTTIALSNLSEENVQTLVGQLLEAPLILDPTGSTGSSSIAPLGSIVYQKTQGNPFFVVELLRRLLEQNVVRYNFGKKEWDCYSPDKLHGILMDLDATSAVELVQGRLRTLPREYQVLLLVAACLGVSFDDRLVSTVLQRMEPKLASSGMDIKIDLGDIEVEDSLDECVDKRLLQSSGDEDNIYFFAHDLVKEAALNFGSKRDNLILKRLVGKSILELQEKENDSKMDSLFYTGVDLCNQSTPVLNYLHRDTMIQEWRQMAQWNYMAGQKAMGECSFDQSLKYIETGLALMEAQDISTSEEANALLTNLLAGAAEAIYCVASYDKMHKYANRVLKALSCSDETRYRMMYLKVLSFCAEEKSQAAIDVGREAVQLLGMAKFPKNPSTAAMIMEIIKTKRLLKEHTMESLMALPQLTDEKRLAAIRFIGVIQTPAYMVNPNFGVIAFLKTLRWTIKYGVSSASPSQFAMWGFYNHTFFGDGQANILYSETALKLAEKMGIPETLSQTSMLCFAMTRHWSIEMRDCHAPIAYAHKLAMEGGDSETALQCLVFMDQNTWCTGDMTLQDLGSTLKNHCGTILDCKHKALGNALVGMARSLRQLCLDGDTHYSWLNDSSFEKDLKVPDASTQAFRDVIQLQICCVLGDMTEGLKLAKRTSEVGTKLVAGQCYVARAHFYRGLIFLQSARTGINRKGNLKEANKAIAMLQKWSTIGDVNSRHMLALLEAERADLLGKKDKAKSLYREATNSSMLLNFGHDAALCHERAAFFFLRLGDEACAVSNLEEAARKYKIWGATRKLQQLQEEHKDLLSGQDTVPAM